MEAPHHSHLLGLRTLHLAGNFHQPGKSAEGEGVHQPGKSAEGEGAGKFADKAQHPPGFAAALSHQPQCPRFSSSGGEMVMLHSD